MKKFEGIIICTDLDGTLLRNDKTISNENKEAIEYFKENGGLFTFVTGRMPSYVSDIHDEIKPNAPIGCINGGGLYDFSKKEYMWTCTLPKNVNELIKCIDEQVPNAGIQVSCFENVYFCKENSVMENFREVTKLPNLVCNYNDVKEDVAKIVFGLETEEEIIKTEKILKSHPLADNFGFIRSEKYLYEILPKGMTKGTSITKLSECLGIDINRIIAVGDYNNDVPMLKAAGIGIAVSNACKEAIEAADFVTVSNEEHAIAKVINDLESGAYKII